VCLRHLRQAPENPPPRQPRHPTRSCRRPRSRFLDHHGYPAVHPVGRRTGLSQHAVPLPPASKPAACCMDCAVLGTTAPSPPRLASLPREPDGASPPLPERERLGAIDSRSRSVCSRSRSVWGLKKSTQPPGSCEGLCCTMVQIRFGIGFHTVIWVPTVWNLVCT
jgi:hypothetical protein